MLLMLLELTGTFAVEHVYRSVVARSPRGDCGCHLPRTRRVCPAARSVAARSVYGGDEIVAAAQLLSRGPAKSRRCHGGARWGSATADRGKKGFATTLMRSPASSTTTMNGNASAISAQHRHPLQRIIQSFSVENSLYAFVQPLTPVFWIVWVRKNRGRMRVAVPASMPLKAAFKAGFSSNLF